MRNLLRKFAFGKALAGLLAFLIVATPNIPASGFGIGQLGAEFGHGGAVGGASIPPWVLRPNGILPAAALDIANNRAWVKGVGLVPISALLSITRAATVTSLLPTSAAGASFQTFGPNTLAIVPGSGLQIYGTENYLLNSLAPATQTTGTLPIATFTLWVNCAASSPACSATMSAGTGTGCGTGVATNGTTVNFTITVAGTCTVTVSGSLNAFQLEPLASGTPLIVTTSAPAVRADNVMAAGALLAAAKSAAMSQVAQYIMPPTNTSSNQYVTAFSDGTANNRISTFNQTGSPSAIAFRDVTAGVGTNPATITLLTAGASYKMGRSVRVGLDQTALNGVLQTSSAPTSVPAAAITMGNIGQAEAGGSGYLNSPLAMFTIWNVALDASIAAATQ